MGSDRRAVVVTHSRLRESGTVVPEAVDQLRHAGFQVSIVDNVAAPRFGGDSPRVDPDTEIVVVLGGDGTAIEGLYHLAGEFCPRQADEGAGVTEGTVKTIGILDYSRESVGGAAAKDSSYLYSFLEAQGTCDVHTTAPQPQEPEEYDPNSFVISDPSTWPPVNDPRYENFDPENPATWPNAGQPSETPSPGESGQPNPPETSTSPTPSPVPTPVETPPDEPYIPADGTK